MRTIVCMTALAGLLAGCQPQEAPSETPPEAAAPAQPAAPPTAAPDPAPGTAPPATAPAVITVDLSRFEATGEFTNLDHHGYDENEGRMFYYSNGIAEARLQIPADGNYEITIKAACDDAQNECARFRLRVDGRAASGEVVLASTEPRDYRLLVKMAKGERKLGIEYTNDISKEGEYDRNLFIHGVALKKAN